MADDRQYSRTHVWPAGRRGRTYRKVLVAAALLLLLVPASARAAEDWIPVAPDANPIRPYILGSGTTASMVTDGVNTYALTINNVQKWDGTNWSQLGTYTGSSIVYVGGTLYVAKVYDPPGALTLKIEVAKWVSGAWQSVAEVDSTAEEQALPRLIDVGGTLHLVYHRQNGANWWLYDRSWNGTTWTQTGGVINSAASSGFAVAVGASTTYVAYREAATSDVRVAQWNGSAWVAMGGVVTTGGTVAPVVAWDGDSLHVAAFIGSGRVVAFEYSGGSWLSRYDSGVRYSDWTISMAGGGGGSVARILRRSLWAMVLHRADPVALERSELDDAEGA